MRAERRRRGDSTIVPMADENDLERFVEAQDRVYETACGELAAGRKTSHWMWFVFPQLRDLGRSHTARFYGIASCSEAEAYWRHPVLGARLKHCTQLVLDVRGRTLNAIFGTPDDLKFRSSMTLFAEVAPEEPAFRRAIEQLCDGVADPLTLASLRTDPSCRKRS
jgi:uncharacterized protein (DUF1810 family)